jgi:hypothetical protein
LARNLGLYFAYRRLLLTKHSVLSYRIAFAVPDDTSYMDSVLGGRLAWNSDKEQWKVTVSGISLPLPTPEELSDGSLFRTVAFAVLTSIRAQLVNEVARYNIDEPLSAATPDERQLLRTTASVGSLP